MLLLPLVPADCRLLREQPELLARFNQLGTLLNQLLQYPQLRDR